MTNDPTPNCEAALLSLFVLDVEDGKLLRGKNKPSWTDTNGNEISILIGYKSGGHWHYHIGPYNPNSTPTQAKIRDLNMAGATSAAIIHYRWFDPTAKKKLIILSFGPTHRRFPKTRQSPNHLISRGGLICFNKLIKSTTNK
ncbi:hypothetical protein [Pectobacterium versatile]|uniref:hypothetical protein n=1 Tax=Pectobacterium versatile TaxID=2488639 RepID=UPI001CC41A96|nr:hypothetical protein [Pectobacterium versatile]